jgi:hypothetical protein
LQKHPFNIAPLPIIFHPSIGGTTARYEPTPLFGIEEILS